MKTVNPRTEDSFEKARKAFFELATPEQKPNTSAAEAAQQRNEQPPETALAS